MFPNWKQPKCPLRDKWLNKLFHPYHRTLIRNEKKQTFDARNDLDRSQGHKKFQSQKIKYCIIPFI